MILSTMEPEPAHQDESQIEHCMKQMKKFNQRICNHNDSVIYIPLECQDYDLNFVDLETP